MLCKLLSCKLLLCGGQTMVGCNKITLVPEPGKKKVLIPEFKAVKVDTAEG